MRLTKESSVVVKSRWFSEEDGGYSGRTAGPIAGVGCAGRYCDDMKLESFQRGDANAILASSEWTNWFSEESLGMCPDDAVANEMQCGGRYCDNLRLRCGEMAPGYHVAGSIGYESPFFSEEAGWGRCADGYFVRGVECAGRYCDELKLHCALVEYDPFADPPPRPSDEELAAKFAPQMYFDRNADQFPMPVSKYWEISVFENGDENYRVLPNYSPSSDFDPSTMGLQYSVARCEARTTIVYWAFYKGQQKCFSLGPIGGGDHEGDWEQIMVDVSPDFQAIEKVVFAQHGGHYTKYPNQIDVDYSDGGAHVRTYSGKTSNGQYHDDGGLGGCLYFQDFRNIGDSGKYYNSWKDGKLEDAHTDTPYNNFKGWFGRDGIKGPATRRDDYCTRPDCKDMGCLKNQD